mgnify:CR=1 FL=1
MSILEEINNMNYDELKELNKIGEPDCFIAEQNNEYPLCIGENVNNEVLDKCKECCLYKDFELYHDPYEYYEFIKQQFHLTHECSIERDSNARC